MPSPNEVRASETTGEIVGFNLPDVIQLNLHNRFSGCIAVESSAGTGLLYFRDGEVIHAEQGNRQGEEAFYDVLSWPPGRYRLQPKVTTTRSTIVKTSQHLLLDAARVLDERRAGRGPAPAAAPAPAPAPAPAAAKGAPRAAEILARLRRIPGVAHAAIHGRDGVGVGDDSYESEALGGQALFLSMIGGQLSGLLQSGAILSAVVNGADRHLLLLVTRSHYLSFLVNADAQVGPIEAEIRRVLSSNP